MSHSAEHIPISDHFLSNQLVEEMQADIRGRFLINEPMSGHTSFRIGGPALLYAYPGSIEDVSKLIKFCVSKGIQYTIIGYGTNMLVSDMGFDGCVIDLAESCRNIDIDGNRLIAGAGQWGNDIVRKAAENGLGGLEKLSGIPGGLGGWLKMNCGAFGSSISDHLISTNVICNEGKIQTISKHDAKYSYRSSTGLDGKTIFGAEFLLVPEKSEKLLQVVEDTITERYRRNIMTLPSAGSLFKNPPDNYAAKLIESVGGKGMQFGGMEISPSHANFAINTRGGTASDVVDLINTIKMLVQDNHNIELELELQLLGFNDEI
ncbi:MAG: UDP-N-acetylmuramate dehydrogenase [Calditrichaeota bacterium]|nr:UDP-N-acetylmuramate dehydrogenase [Calditrichota bacterium]